MHVHGKDFNIIKKNNKLAIITHKNVSKYMYSVASLFIKDTIRPTLPVLNTCTV